MNYPVKRLGEPKGLRVPCFGWRASPPILIWTSNLESNIFWTALKRTEFVVSLPLFTVFL
jgi:hypothetical protein